MYNNVSEEFVNLIGDSGRTFKAKLVNGTDKITDIRSVSLYQAENGEDNIGIGGCVASYIDCTIGNTTFQLEDTEYELQIGLKIDEENYEYVPIGKFTPKKPDIKSEVTTFIAYDRMMSKGLNYGYFSDIENYPVDAKAILSEIQEQTGIEIDISELPDGVMIDKRKVISDTSYNEEGEEIQIETYENPFEGYTKQEAICYIAQMYGKFAFVDRYGIVRFRWFESSGLQYNRSQYKDDVNQSEKEFTLGVIKCGDLISGAGATGISIDNPVMTQAILDDVYQKIGGFKCRGTSLTLIGDLRIDIGDIIQVYIDNEYRDIPVMRLETYFDGGISQKVYVYGSTEEVEEKRGPTTQRIDRMYNELLLVKEIMANKVSADNIQARIATLGFASIKELSAEVAKMGLLTADQADIRYLTADSANLKYANIDLSNIANGTITTALIATGAIGTAQIADGSITDAKIVGLTANKITAGILDAATIEVVNLNAANITVGTINGHQIAPGAISLDNLGSDVTDKIAATESDVAAAVADAKKAILDSSTANTNANNALNTANTAKSTAESAKTTADANAEVILSWCKDNNTLYIDGAKLYAGTVVSDAIAAGAIVADKIASGAVTAVKISSGAITTDKLAANAVTAAKIASGTITATQIAASTITGSKIASGTVTADNIASNAITADKIVSSAITAAKIASGAVSTDKLAANAVTAAKIASGAITADKISVSSLSALTANLGTVTAGIIQSSNYVKDSTGMQMNLSTGAWDSKYTKIDSEGKISCNNIDITNGNITLIGDTFDDIRIKILESGDKSTVNISPGFIEIRNSGIPDYTTNLFGYGLNIIKDGAPSSVLSISPTYMQFLGMLSVKDDIVTDGDVKTSSGVSLKTLNTNLGNIGVTKAGTTQTKSVANNTVTEVEKMTLTPGLWIVFGKLLYPSNSTGRRYVDISGHAQQSVQACASGITSLSTSWFFKVTRNTDIYLRAYQSSGGTLTLTEQNFDAVRIK